MHLLPNRVISYKNPLLLREPIKPQKTMEDLDRADKDRTSWFFLSVEYCTAAHLGLFIGYLIFQDQENAGPCPSIVKCSALGACILLLSQKSNHSWFFFFLFLFQENVNYITS